MSGYRRRPVALYVIAVVLVALLAACGGDSPSTTTAAATEPTTTPTTEASTTTSSASDTTATTEPSTTETTASDTSTTDTTVADAEADLTPVEPEEGLTRLFPISPGWVVESSDNSVTVGITVGSAECYGLASADVEETADEVLVTLTAGFRPDATGCGGAAPAWTYEFELSEPLGDRPVVDTHTGLELGTERPDPDA